MTGRITDEQIAEWQRWAELRNSSPEILKEARGLVDTLVAERDRADLADRLIRILWRSRRHWQDNLRDLIADANRELGAAKKRLDQIEEIHIRTIRLNASNARWTMGAGDAIRLLWSSRRRWQDRAVWYRELARQSADEYASAKYHEREAILEVSGFENDLEAATRERDELKARLEAVRELHARYVGNQTSSVFCLQDGFDYPCPTIRLLDGEVQ